MVAKKRVREQAGLDGRDPAPSLRDAEAKQLNVTTLRAQATTLIASGNTGLPTSVSNFLLNLLSPYVDNSLNKRQRVTKEIRSSCKLVAQVARDFSLDFKPFGPKYEFKPPRPSITIPEHLPHLTQFIQSYVENFDRGSEAACRAPIDVLLNQCLILLKGLRFHSVTGYLDTKEGAVASVQSNPFASSVIVHGGVSLDWTHPDTWESWTGLIDYAIGIEHPVAWAEHLPTTSGASRAKKPRLPYQAYLLVVEAKRSHDVDSAVAQLYGYLAVLHKLRKPREKHIGHSGEIYGIATDGLIYTFLRITSEGTMQEGPRIELNGGSDETRKVVSAVVGILQQEAEVLSDIIRVVKGTSGVVSRVVSADNSAAMHSVFDMVDGECSRGEGIGSIGGTGDGGNNSVTQPAEGQLEQDFATDPVLGHTLEEALFGVETGPDGVVLVDAEALDTTDTSSVMTGAEEEEEE
ncbi:hypothetical protein L211DRAFT_865803 [Terfezia boudieri ATCC MYA-4762]|uniref:Uncharacterized protein n=1 Tax=Terfezia boudieri ATCC MYA-4762 TaxID=1051890 RepID=A0A3N4M2S1_9PEZI|nr:hypothetical protein L211DRAFT_865803 [Terfezia boudieri ATCC MYA-4762]